MNVIIGAASGMGAAVARHFIDRGPTLLADRDGDGDLITACDITNQDDVDALVVKVETLDALVVTAGLSPSMAGGRTIYEVNLIAMDRVLRTFEPVLAQGSVAICSASMAAHMGPPPPGADRVLDDPSSPTFLDDLAATGVDVDEPQSAYLLSKIGVVRLVQRRAGAWGRRGLGSCRSRRASSTPAWDASKPRTNRSWPRWSPAAPWLAMPARTRSPQWPPSSPPMTHRS